MNDRWSLAVCVLKRAANVHDEAEFLRKGQIRHAVDDFVEALAAQELHGDERRVAFMPELVDGDNVGVAQAAGGAGLRIKALEVLGIFGEASGKGLERDGAVDKRVAGLVHDTHRALADLTDDFEFAELLDHLRGVGRNWAALSPAAWCGALTVPSGDGPK